MHTPVCRFRADQPIGLTYDNAMPHYTDDSKGRPVQAPLAWVVAILTLGYMLPWAIAATRGKSNTGAIGWLNLLLGWSVIGWIVALVMACSAHQVVSGGPPPPSA
jgi:hypothetical protein